MLQRCLALVALAAAARASRLVSDILSPPSRLDPPRAALLELEATAAEGPSFDKWQVVGGGRRGILVSKDMQIDSSKEEERLMVGAIVKQLARDGKRLKYELLEGVGPSMGWVTIEASGKTLLKRVFDESYTSLVGSWRYDPGSILAVKRLEPSDRFAVAYFVNENALSRSRNDDFRLARAFRGMIIDPEVVSSYWGRGLIRKLEDGTVVVEKKGSIVSGKTDDPFVGTFWYDPDSFFTIRMTGEGEYSVAQHTKRDVDPETITEWAQLTNTGVPGETSIEDATWWQAELPYWGTIRLLPIKQGWAVQKVAVRLDN